MNIYLLERDGFGGYDTYDSLVVIAEDIEKASRVKPVQSIRTWVDPELVTVTLLGKSISEVEEIVCSSFNAG